LRPRPFRLERFFAEHEFSVPHLLCASDCEPVKLNELLELADTGSRALWEDLSLGYTEPAGHPLLREEIARLYRGLKPEDVLVTSGAEEAIFLLTHALLAPGDRVVYTAPAYQSLHELSRALGCEVVPWRLREGAGWDLDGLRRLAGENARAAVVNFPHNPTGYLPDEGFFRELVELCAGKGVRLVSDEVYRLLEYEPEARLPAACELDGRAVSIGVMSKAFGLAGLRIGWLASRDRELLARTAALKDYTTIWASAPSETLSTIALRAKERILERNLGIIRSNLERLEPVLEEYGGLLSWHRPRAGCTGFLRLAVPADGFCRELLEGAGVLLLPGSLYPGADSFHARIGFGRRDFPAGLEALEGYLAKNYSRIQEGA
jgi:aspartate/methionine/tyrosine aminotransferase